MTARPVLRRRLSLLAAVALLAGCASAPPPRYYTLVSPPTASPVTADAGYAIDLLPVRVPAEVDVRPLVLRAGDGELQLQDEHQWAAPLADQIREALSQRLSAKLGVTDVAGLAAADDAPRVRIQVVVTRFESVFGDYAALAMRWSLRALPGHAEPLACSAVVVRPVQRGYAALVQGQQRALAAMADKIAVSVRRLRAGQRHCAAGG